MSATGSPFPDVQRADAGVALVAPLYVATPHHQRAAAQRALSAFAERPLPPGFVSLSAFVSTDGQTLLTYAQWSSDEAYRRFEAQDREQDAGQTRRAQPIRYALYRSSVLDPDARPGLLVAPTFDVDGPDRQERSIDALVDGPLSRPFPGMLASHFHVSLDGTRVLNWAEWADGAAHAAFMASSLPAQCFEAITMPGVRGIGGKRYTLLGSVST